MSLKSALKKINHAAADGAAIVSSFEAEALRDHIRELERDKQELAAEVAELTESLRRVVAGSVPRATFDKLVDGESVAIVDD